MMNALSLAVHLERHAEVRRARRLGKERAADHRTRAADFLPARAADHLAAAAADNRARLGGASKWLVRQRTKTALHRPTGTTQ